jgi:type IV pilus assembly protein PilF
MRVSYARRVPRSPVGAIFGIFVLLLAPAVLAQGTDPKLDAARINVRLGLEYLRQGQTAIAREKIEKALQQYPRDVGVQMGAGLLYEQLQDPKRAEQHYRQVLRIDSRNPEGQNALGAFLCRNGEPRKGEEIFLQAARNPLYRTPEVAFTNAGVCARRAGRLEQAEQYLRLALAQRNNYSEALVQMAGVSFERGNHMQARAFLQRYLAVAPGTADALLLGFQIEHAIGDVAAAGDYADQLRNRHSSSPETRVVEEFARKERE